MAFSPSSTGNLIFGLLISGISSCLASLNFWTTILNLRPYYLTLKTVPIISLSVLDYSFHAFINITNLIWYTSCNILWQLCPRAHLGVAVWRSCSGFAWARISLHASISDPAGTFQNTSTEQRISSFSHKAQSAKQIRTETTCKFPKP